jgi:C2H2 type zinc finger protein
MSIETHQCPYCELRFATVSELKLHIQTDHPDHDQPENGANAS